MMAEQQKALLEQVQTQINGQLWDQVMKTLNPRGAETLGPTEARPVQIVVWVQR